MSDKSSSNSPDEKTHKNTEKNTSLDQEDNIASNEAKKRVILDQKLKNFFENICSQTIEDVNESELETGQNDIHYGNISNKYDPAKSVTTIEKLNEVPTENHLEKLPPNLINLLIETSNEMFKDKDIHLNKKDCLLKLIERNRKNSIVCPFDELAYIKIKLLDLKILTQDDCQINRIIFFNPESIMDLMPNCLSTFMLQFFFEIFQPSELKYFNRKTLDLMLKLKNCLKPESYFDTNYKTIHLIENVLCNCFALYKYKFSLKYKTGFLNYVISLYCLVDSMASDAKAVHLAQVLPNFIEALILSGFLTRQDIPVLESEYTSKLAKYKEIFFSDVNKIFDKHKIMTLKSMSRILVRQYLVSFSHSVIEKLKLDDKSKHFLEFEYEIQNLLENEFHLE